MVCCEMTVWRDVLSNEPCKGSLSFARRSQLKLKEEE